MLSIRPPDVGFSHSIRRIRPVSQTQIVHQSVGLTNPSTFKASDLKIFFRCVAMGCFEQFLYQSLVSVTDGDVMAII